MKKKNWTFWVDKGGTFTDIIALSPKKDVYLEKILSSSKSYYDDPISFGIRSIINKSNISLLENRLEIKLESIYKEMSAIWGKGVSI